MNILFIGSTQRGFLTLQALIESGMRVVGILSLTQDAHELDRYEGPIRQLAMRFGIPFQESRFIRSPDLIRWATKNLSADAAICVGVRILLPVSFYQAFPRGCWGVHDSLLPEYRGFAPLNWSIINDEPKTGVSLFRIAEQMDGGEILLQKEIPIGPTETAPDLYGRVCQATIEVVLEGCHHLQAGTGLPVPQDYAVGSFTCTRTPHDGEIDWSQTSRSIYNLIRALTFPYPGAYTFYQGRRLIILEAKEVHSPPCYRGRIHGRIVRRAAGTGVEVLTGDGLIQLISVSTDGRTAQAAEDVIRSVKASLGISVGELQERILHLEQRLEELATHAAR